MRFGFTVTIVFSLWVLFAFSGCSDMIRSLRADSAEADEQEERDRDIAEGTADRYRPRTLNGVSANNVSEFEPPAARAYRKTYAQKGALAYDTAADPGPDGYHRVTRDDFVDKVARENSLWDGQGQSNYLFANNRRREPGDMITADVEKDLRREIQYQLWMTLPPEQRKTKKPITAGNAADTLTSVAGATAKDAANAALSGDNKSATDKAKDAAEEAAKSNMGASGKDDDLIRMEVVENLGNGMIRMLGQKRVIYKGVSRIVEVAALVNGKDVDDANHAKSSNFLDVKAQVIQ
ncbi:MAG TPA: flagellar basal body L-ring protein FlgH [Bdellovibrionota bacterium]|jgi:flagellar basal body L-ring protein FlgH